MYKHLRLTVYELKYCEKRNIRVAWLIKKKQNLLLVSHAFSCQWGGKPSRTYLKIVAPENKHGFPGLLLCR